MRTFPHFATLTLLTTVVAAALTTGCQPPSSTASASGATSHTVAMQKKWAEQFSGVSQTDRADAEKGLIARPEGQIKNAKGEVIWDFDDFKFIQSDKAPDTVNPSLWRQAILNNQVGLFKVTEGIYQLRGFDLSNMTLIEGKTGWVVVDTLTSRETAEYALAFARKHLGDKPVTGVVFTHSHVDHFGGALGVIDQQQIGKTPVIAPAGFMEEATSENILAGSAMGRRSMYMYGKRLDKSVTGLVDNGLGKAVAYGTIGILPPTRVVQGESERIAIDGVDFQFFNVPGSEAPSEFTFYLPAFKAYGSAELVSHTLHNLYTLRGAKVRDALRWSEYIEEATVQAKDAEVLFGQHNWPVWGNQNIQRFLEQQRDVYRFIHDQTVRLMNQGYGPREIAETVQLPKSLASFMSARGYYGTVKHNTKAVYQFYLGWFDANPSRLDPLPQKEAASKYVEVAGGADKALNIAQIAFDNGEYRWAAEWLNHLVQAQPDNASARELLAKTYEQMGYVAESGPWRNFYLTGAYELRKGNPDKGIDRTALKDMLAYTPTEHFLKAMAGSLNAEKAEGLNLTVNLTFTDTKENYVLRLSNSVLHHKKAPPAIDAQATLKLTRPFFLEMMTGNAGAKEMLLSKETKIEGSTVDLGRFFNTLDKTEGKFAIARPQ